MEQMDTLITGSRSVKHVTSVPMQDAPFFTVKLQVKMLPCLVFFQNGVACDRAVGFDEYGASDNFPTTAVERRLLKSGECLQLLPEWLPDDDHDFLHNITSVKCLVAFSPNEGKELLQMPHQ